MAQVNLSLKKSLFVPKFYPLLLDYSHRWEVYMGSAGSSKSYFITQKIIVRCCREKIKVLVCRRTATTLRNTCFSLFKDVIGKWQLTPYVKIRETDFNIKFPNGSEIIFTGLDEETKLLSLNDIGAIFIEEAFEVPKPIVEQLNIRLRG
jgi:phage terminase large subunit